MLYDILHRSTYRYPSQVSISHHLARLRPRDLTHQQCLSHTIQITPTASLGPAHTDYFGNFTQFFSVEGAHETMSVLARSRVETSAPVTPPPHDTPPWETVQHLCIGDRLTEALPAIEFTFRSPLIQPHPRYADYAKPSFPAGRPILEAVLELTQRIHHDFTFDPNATSVATPLEKVFHDRRGVCQDFAQLQIACLRSLGLPARYVSGYLETLPPPGKARLTGADASHAWLAVYTVTHGWIDIDPTNNVTPSDRHISNAWGRDFSDVSPLRGVLVGSGRQALEVAVDVIPVAEPRPSS